MLFPGKQKRPLLLTIIALFGLFSTEISNLFALDAANDTGKYPGFKARGEITRFEGETLYYDISFLWFDNAASAKVQFKKKEVGIIQLWKPAPKSFSDFSLPTVNII